MSTKEQKIQGRKAELPALCFLNLSAHFYVWVTVWVRRLTHILTHTVSAEKSKKNPRNRMISGIFWSCWADSNRRPHPYQVLESLPPLAVQGFSVLFSPKRMRSRPVHSVVSIRSFPRVGHGVGQAKNTGRISWRTPVFSSCRFAQVTRVTSSTKWRSFFAK